MTLRVVEHRLEEFGVVLEAMEWGRKQTHIQGSIAREGLGLKRQVEKIILVMHSACNRLNNNNKLYLQDHKWCFENFEIMFWE